MRQLAIILAFIVNSLVVFGQESLPGYFKIMDTFFSKYEFENNFEKDLRFAKKRNGWHVLQINRYDSDRVVLDSLYWSLSKKEFNLLPDDFPKKKNDDHPENIIEKYIEAISGSYDIYSYERNRYYGYEGWDIDMIHDFAKKKDLSDTLIEGLARAYAFHAERYTWYGFGGKPYDNDPLKSKLGILEPRSKERIRKFKENIEHSISLYRLLSRKNPLYRCLVGTAKMKILNEQMHLYQQLIIAGYKGEAISHLKNLDSYTPFRNIGYNYLNACPRNAILITFGDNDTYPLWYVQEKEGFRKDVAVLNYSLLGFPPYLDMLKRNKIVIFSSQKDFYGSTRFGYSRFIPQPDIAEDQELSVSQFLQYIQSGKYPDSSSSAGILSSYPSHRIIWQLDVKKWSRNPNNKEQDYYMNFKPENYVLGNEFMMLDIAHSNIYSRPICFASPAPFFGEAYQQKDKIIYRLLPYEEIVPPGEEQIKKEIEYINKQYKAVFTRSSNEIFYGDVMDGVHDALYATLISYFLDSGNLQEAKRWVASYLASFGGYPIPTSLSNIDIAKLMFKTGYGKQALALLERCGEDLVSSFKTFSALILYNYRKNCLYQLDQIKEVLEENNQKSTVIDNLYVLMKEGELR